MTSHANDWREAGACLAADPDLFFPIATGALAAGQIARALAICSDCAVRLQCLDFALRTGEVNGIWGGTTPEERIRARRRNMHPRRGQGPLPVPRQRPGTRPGTRRIA